MEKNDSFTDVSVAQIFENCVGCKWTLHILAQIRAGIVRPGQLERTAAGLTTKVLNQRLAKLSRFGIVRRESFAEVPPRVEYRLTAFGDDLVEILDQVERLQYRYTQSTSSETEST